MKRDLSDDDYKKYKEEKDHNKKERNNTIIRTGEVLCKVICICITLFVVYGIIINSFHVGKSTPEDLGQKRDAGSTDASTLNVAESDIDQGTYGSVKMISPKGVSFEADPSIVDQLKQEGYKEDVRVIVLDSESGEEYHIPANEESIKDAKEKGYILRSEYRLLTVNICNPSKQIGHIPKYMEKDAKKQGYFEPTNNKCISPECVDLKEQLGYSKKEIESGYTGVPRIPSSFWSNGDYTLDNSIGPAERLRNPPLGSKINNACGY